MSFLIKEVYAAPPPCEVPPGYVTPPGYTGDPCAVPITGLNQIFANVVSVALGFAGISFFVLMLVAGFQWLTSGGDPARLQSARNTLTYAVGGMILVALAYLILVFIARFTGVTTILNFRVGP